MAADLNWIFSTHGNFLGRFGFDRHKIVAEYDTWKVSHPEYLTTSHFFGELLRQAVLYNMQHADSELEYATTSVEIISRMLEFSKDLSRENRNYITQRLYLDKLIISRETLPFKFDVQIKGGNCCSYCDRQNGKIFSLEKIFEKGYLPHGKCKNAGSCKCSYLIVPLIDK